MALRAARALEVSSLWATSTRCVVRARGARGPVLASAAVALPAACVLHRPVVRCGGSVAAPVACSAALLARGDVETRGRPRRGWRLWWLVGRRVTGWLCALAPVAWWAPVAYVFKPLRESWWRHLLWATERSGPTVTKLAQWSATRRDVFPREWCARMERLQDAARPHGALESELALLDAFGASWRDVVAIEAEPVGSGCVAQVHRGVLARDGRAVAVKVVQPGRN